MSNSTATIGFKVLVFAQLTVVRADRASAAKPNVILVMAGDLGIGDVSPTNPDELRTCLRTDMSIPSPS